jgi:hypothetical protein
MECLFSYPASFGKTRQLVNLNSRASTRRFQFQKRSQLFIRMHNDAFRGLDVRSTIQIETEISHAEAGFLD